MPSRPPVFRPAGYQPYDQTRPNERQRGYTKRWAKASAHFKAAHPLCLGCSAVGRVSATEITDHIVPHQGDDPLFWNPDNWQPCCGTHHNTVKQALEQLYLQGQARPADLRLDSPMAIDLTRKMM